MVNGMDNFGNSLSRIRQYLYAHLSETYYRHVEGKVVMMKKVMIMMMVVVVMVVMIL
jgi:hypothetical protein